MPVYEIMLVCDWCRTVNTTRSATNASAAHLVTMATQHAARLTTVVRALVRLPHLKTSMFDHFFQAPQCWQ